MKDSISSMSDHRSTKSDRRAGWSRWHPVDSCVITRRRIEERHHGNVIDHTNDSDDDGYGDDGTFWSRPYHEIITRDVISSGMMPHDYHDSDQCDMKEPTKSSVVYGTRRSANRSIYGDNTEMISQPQRARTYSWSDNAFSARKSLVFDCDGSNMYANDNRSRNSHRNHPYHEEYKTHPRKELSQQHQQHTPRQHQQKQQLQEKHVRPDRFHLQHQQHQQRQQIPSYKLSNKSVSPCTENENYFVNKDKRKVNSNCDIIMANIDNMDKSSRQRHLAIERTYRHQLLSEVEEEKTSGSSGHLPTSWNDEEDRIGLRKEYTDVEQVGKGDIEGMTEDGSSCISHHLSAEIAVDVTGLPLATLSLDRGAWYKN